MDEPNRIERMVGEIVGLRLLVATLLEKQGGAENMLNNFPKPMNAKIA